MQLKLAPVFLASALAAAVGGCFDSRSSAEPEVDGGRDAGDAALIGDGGDAGAIDCDGSLALDAYCGRKGMDCSTSFDELRERSCDPMYRHFYTAAQPNSCGGRSLLSRIGNSTMRYDYDAADHLHSVQSSDDIPYGRCMRNEYVYGTPCELVDTEEPACSDEDAGI